VPGFINVDVSKEYGTHFDFGPVAVDLTEDFAGFALGAAAAAGVARDGGGCVCARMRAEGGSLCLET
jgi:hypothetical protein